MKKAFSLKKKLPKVLAAALAAACFAGAVPANAAGVTRAYSTIGSYGSVLEDIWGFLGKRKGGKGSFYPNYGGAGITDVSKRGKETTAG